jgi:AcrR family transcriptional regulator
MQAKTEPKPSPTRTFTESRRRDQVVAATIETIAELGFAKASYARIAERAGLSSTGLISYHFASKADLVGAVLAEIGAVAQQRIAPRVDAEPTVLGKLRARVEAELEWVDEFPTHVKALYEISMHAKNDDGDLEYGEALTVESNVNELEPLLRAGQELGELRQFDTVLMALAMKATVDMAIYRMSLQPTLSPQGCAKEIFELFRRATASDPDPR